MTRPFGAALLAAVFAAAVPPVVLAQTADDAAAARARLDTVRTTLDSDREKKAALDSAAAEQAGELDRLRAELRAAAASIQAHEAAITDIEAQLADLAAENDAKVAELHRRKGQLGDTLAALQRMSLRPTAALIVSPGDPNDVIRSGLLLRTAVPQIEVQTKILRSQLAEIAALRTDMAHKRAELESASLALAREQERLAELTTAKNRAFQQTEEDRQATAEHIARLTKEAKSLEDLLDQLNTASRAVPVAKPRTDGPSRGAGEKLIATPQLPPITEARGRLTLPAQGTIAQSYGAPTATGGKARGITLQTRPAALVVAPWEGQIVFAGVFRNFGRILIIDHGEGYHSLIAGLDRIDAQVNQWVLAGEPVGVAGGDSVDNFLQGEGRADQGQTGGAADVTGGASVYVELRHDGQPINPQPWMAARTDRTRG